MENLETIANTNAESFMRKHFSNLNEKDKMVKAMRQSIENTIIHSLIMYQREMDQVRFAMK